MSSETHHFYTTVVQENKHGEVVREGYLTFYLTFVRAFGTESAPENDAETTFSFGPAKQVSPNSGPIMVKMEIAKLISERDRDHLARAHRFDQLLRFGHIFTRLLTRHLYNMGIPIVEKKAIVKFILKVAKVAIPELPIIVKIMHGITTRGDEKVRTDTHISASKAAIESLEKVRLDSLESEDTIRQEQCVICWNRYDCFGAADEVADHQNMIARLPCRHHYHTDCIVRWLEIQHVCPMCRYPMQFLEETTVRKYSLYIRGMLVET